MRCSQTSCTPVMRISCLSVCEPEPDIWALVDLFLMPSSWQPGMKSLSTHKHSGLFGVRLHSKELTAESFMDFFFKTLFQVWNPELAFVWNFSFSSPDTSSHYSADITGWTVFFYWLVTCSQSDWEACLDSWDVCPGYLSGWVIFPPHHFLLFVPRQQN